MIRSLTLKMQVVPPVMRRQRHVLLLIKDENNRYVLGKKDIYPPGIVRMVGGGVEKTETFLAAASRELYEELKYHLSEKHFLELMRVRAAITDAQQQKYLFETAIFFLDVKRQPLFPSDDLDDLARLTDAEFLRLIQRYAQLSKQIDNEYGFAWYDYGQLYGKIHQFAWEAVHALTDKTSSFL